MEEGREVEEVDARWDKLALWLEGSEDSEARGSDWVEKVTV